MYLDSIYLDRFFIVFERTSFIHIHTVHKSQQVTVFYCIVLVVQWFRFDFSGFSRCRFQGIATKVNTSAIEKHFSDCEHAHYSQ